MRFILLAVVIFLPLTVFAQQVSRSGEQAIQLIDNRTPEFTAISDSIWKYAEPSYKEVRSSQLIMNTLAKEGFTITRDILNMPSMFIAEYGKGKPVIGLFGEYDADPNASNKMVPRHEELVKDGFGHGGHHNLLGVGSLAAAIAIKELIKTGKLRCTIRYYGSTDEGRGGTRRFLSDRGYFRDLDFSLYWHPSPVTWASTAKWDALTELSASFSSKDTAMVKYAYMLMRDNIKETSNTEYRISHIQTDTAFTVKIQSVTQGLCDTLYSRIDTLVNFVTNETGTAVKLSTKRIHQFIPNVAAMRVVHANMLLLPPISYTEEEQKYAREMQLGINAKPEGISYRIGEFVDVSKDRKMYGYSSDIGEASWIAPEAYLVVKTLPFVGMHSWQGTVFSGHSIGHKGMIQASKILALTIIDYVQDKALQKAIRADFELKKKFYRGN